MQQRWTTPRQRVRVGVWWLSLLVTAVAVVGIVAVVDAAALTTAWHGLKGSPAAVLFVLVVYAGAFVLRSLAWVRILPTLPFGHALAAMHVALGANHVLPARLGEVLRITSVVRRTSIGTAAATASTVSLRAADVLAVLSLAVVLAPSVAFDVIGAWALPLFGVAFLVAIFGGTWLSRLRRRGQRDLRLPGAVTLGLVVVSWLLEGVVVWQAAAWTGLSLTPAEAVLVTAVTIAAQVVAVAPGGFGTYEAAGTAALVALGADPGTALAVALTAHAVKTGYALVTGAVATVLPAPSLLGRLRLPATSRSETRAPMADAEALDPSRPIVLFMPAHDEEEAVGTVVRRVPSTVAGHPVSCIVVDDGSRDGTVIRAVEAGAEVISLPHNRGLGAAVRRGLAEAVERGAVAVAFCDADGEYAPEELERLVEPILAGEADYVVGSRFAGEIQRMLPHRRLGNRTLTAILRFISRTPISDGQSGYRALSAGAAAHAEISHDFNYAQVLTIDLLAKGARYHEVPISYSFRETGRSFVRLGRYLRAVVPAVHRLLNRDVPVEARLPSLAPSRLSGL